MNWSPELDQIREWLDTEHEYNNKKYPPESEDVRTAEGVGPDSEWRMFVNQYMHRAHVLGLENPLGRQALAKSLATLEACVESVVRVHGPLPQGGTPSGEIK